MARKGITPNMLTATGFFFAIINFVCLALSLYGLALFFIILNRLMDGLDGAVARQKTDTSDNHKTQETDLGGFLDIVSDFIFYAGSVFFFAVGQSQHALAAAFLLFCFMGTASSFLAYAIIASKRGINHSRQGKKSFFYLSGITEGSETVLFLILICLLPSYFAYLSVTFGILCLLTTVGRIGQAIRDFKM